MSRLVSREEIQKIGTMMAQRGIPVHVWLPIMHLESGGNVKAHNPRGEDSRGLFQINLQAGEGGRWTPDFVRGLNLFDPLVNTRAILSEHWLGNTRRLKTMAAKADPAEQAAYMYRRGIRPRYTTDLDRRVRYLATDGLQDLKNRYGVGGDFPFVAAQVPDIDRGAEIRTIEEDITEGWGYVGERAVKAVEGVRGFFDWSLKRILILIFGIPVLIFAVFFLIMPGEAEKYVRRKMV